MTDFGLRDIAGYVDCGSEVSSWSEQQGVFFMPEKNRENQRLQVNTRGFFSESSKPCECYSVE